MAKLSDDLQVHITWDTEPTEAAKDFIRIEVLTALKETFEGGSWLREFVRTEVHKVLKEECTLLSGAMQRGKQ